MVAIIHASRLWTLWLFGKSRNLYRKPFLRLELTFWRKFSRFYPHPILFLLTLERTEMITAPMTHQDIVRIWKAMAEKKRKPVRLVCTSDTHGLHRHAT